MTHDFSDYDTAIKINPDDAKAYCNRGMVKADLGQYTDAIADYDIAIRLKTDYADAYYNRGLAKYMLGRISAANIDAYNALRLAKKAGDAELKNKAENILRSLKHALYQKEISMICDSGPIRVSMDYYLPKSESATALVRYTEELNRFDEWVGKDKELTDKEKEIQQRSREANIILKRLRQKHVRAWHLISILLGIVPFGSFKYLVLNNLQNTWVRALLYLGATIFLFFVPVILLVILIDNEQEKQKALAIQILRLYLVEKWNLYDISKEFGIPTAKLRKILHRYIDNLNE